jgi:hypothetical protein
MSRNDLRTPYPFHDHNPRQHTACCAAARKPYKRGLRHWLRARWARIRLMVGV